LVATAPKHVHRPDRESMTTRTMSMFSTQSSLQLLRSWLPQEILIPTPTEISAAEFLLTYQWDYYLNQAARGAAERILDHFHLRLPNTYRDHDQAGKFTLRHRARRSRHDTFVDYAPLHFQSWSQLTTFDSKFILQQRNLFYPLILGEFRCKSGNLAFEEIDDARMFAEFRVPPALMPLSCA